VKGIFACKDALAALYRQEENFRRLDFLGARPGGYASWYNHYTRINETIILRDLEEITARENLVKLWYLDRGKPAVFQIDDGWQKAVGDWEANAQHFPRGMKAVASDIESAGMIPGLWLAPFIVTKKARVYRERPDWLLRDEEGNLVRAGWNPKWDGVYYCLDISRDDVLAYLEGLTGAALEWGFRYLKLDFLYAGFLGGLAPAAYDRACAVLTAKTADPLGKSAVYLGCGLPLGASYRRFPLSRTGTDTRESWDWKAAKFLGHLGRPSALLNLRDTLGRSFLNGSVYKSDPDVVFLRTKNCALSENEKELIILVNFMFAGQIIHSDGAGFLCEADRALTRRIMARCEKLDGDEYGAALLFRDVYRIESRSGRVNGIVNLSDVPIAMEGTVLPHSIRLFG
jgi:alpha-galactosidase